MHRILIVEDDADIREILGFNLENAGYEVLSAASAEEGLEIFTPDTELILLDVMLPGLSGYQMARKVRTEIGSEVPIVFLTARTTENDVLTGFSAGGDDYISKPFSINEVLARVKAILKRSQGRQQTAPETLGVGPLQMDSSTGKATLEGSELQLSRKEFDLLALLAKHPGRYFSRAALIGELWKDSPYVLDRTVDVHIARIRQKLGRHHNLVKNRTGFGYYLDNSYEIDDH